MIIFPGSFVKTGNKVIWGVGEDLSDISVSYIVSVYAYHHAAVFLAICVLSAQGQTLRGVCVCACVHACVSAVIM